MTVASGLSDQQYHIKTAQIKTKDNHVNMIISSWSLTNIKLDCTRTVSVLIKVHFVFDGRLVETRNMTVLSETEVVEIASKFFGGSDIQVLNYVIERKSDRSIGHMGIHLVLTIKVFAKQNEFIKSFFVKTYEVKNSGDDFIGETGIFQKEVDLYKFLIEDIRRFVGEPVWCPKYYYCKTNILVLEDLSEIDFRMTSDKTSLDVDHLKVALLALSSMHASSWLLEEVKSVPLNAVYPQIFKEILYEENKPDAPSTKWVSWQMQDLLLGIDYLQKYSSKEKMLIRSLFVGQIMQIFSLSKPSKKYKNLLVHGDVWSNNLLFRYSDNIPVECKLVDFQFSRYAPPAHDIMHLLHYTTEKAFRDEHELGLLLFYFESLSEKLGACDERIRSELSWDDFLFSCREYKELALVQCLLSSHYLLGPATLHSQAETYKSYEKFLSAHRQEYMKKFFESSSYASKVTDTFVELIDGYILKK